MREATLYRAPTLQGIAGKKTGITDERNSRVARLPWTGRPEWSSRCFAQLTKRNAELLWGSYDGPRDAQG